MVQVATAVIGALGGPLGVGGAAISNAIGIPMSGGLIGNALGIGPKGKSRVAAELTVKIGETPRMAIIGEAATAGSLADAFNYGGKYVTDWAVFVFDLADHRCHSLTGFYVNDEYVAFAGDGAVSGYNNQLYVWWRPGTEDQSVPAVLTDHGPGWTSDDNGAGIARVVVAINADAADAKDPTWSGGWPSFLWVVKGLLCYDSRLDSTVAGGTGPHRWDDPSTREWTDNLIVCRYNFARGIYACDRVDEPDMLLLGRGLSAVEQPPEAMFARANLCDETVDGAPRYRANGTVYSNQSFVEVDEMFAAACGGTIVQRGGAVEVEPGQANAVVATITDADFVSGTSRGHSEQLSDADPEWVNTVVPRYIEPAQKWADHGAPIRRDIADVLADGGPRETTLNLQLVRHAAQAGRVGEIVRRRGRMLGRGTGTLGPRFVALEEGDWVGWSSERHFGGETRTVQIGSYSLERSWRNAITFGDISSAVFDDGDFLEDLAEAAQQDAPPSIGAPDVEAWDLAAEMLDDGGPAIPILAITGAVEDPAARQVRFEYWRDDGVTDPEDVEDWNAKGTFGAGVTRVEISEIASGAGYYAAVSYVVDGIPGDRLIMGPVTAGSLTADLGELDPVAAALLDALVDEAAAAGDDNVLTVREKIDTLLPALASLGARYSLLTARAAALGVSTSAASSARTDCLAYLAGLSPPYDDVEQETTLSADLASAFPTAWSDGGAAPVANGLYTTLTDNSAGGFEYVSMGAAVTAGATYTAAVPVKKDAVAGATRAPTLRIINSNGTFKFADIQIDTSTGATASAGTPAASGCHSRNDNEWLVWVSLALPGDVTSIAVYIYPAVGPLGSNVAATTGAIDVRDPVLVMGAFDRIGRYAHRWRLKSYEEQLDALAKAISEMDGTTSLQIDGPSIVNVNASVDGNAAAFLPIDVGYSATVGSASVTTAATWARTVTSASGSITCTIDAGTGTLNITALTTPTATVRVDCTYNGVTKSKTVTVNRIDAEGSTGGGSSPSSSTSSFTSINSTTFTSIASLVITAASAAPALSAPALACNPSFSGGTSGSPWNVEMKWVRENGVTDVDVGSTASSSPDPEVVLDGEGHLASNSGAITCNATDSGRTIGVQYTYYLQAKLTVGSRTMNFVGTASVTS